MCDTLSEGLGLGIKIKRNIGQARDGGNDIDLPPFLIECKRRKTLGTVYGWLQQAIDSLPEFLRRHGASHAIPVVVAREDNGESIAILRLQDFIALARPAVRDVLSSELAGAEIGG